MKNIPKPSADIRPDIVRPIMDLFLSGVDLKRSLRTGKTERRDAFATDASSSRSNMEICSGVREWEAPCQVMGLVMRLPGLWFCLILSSSWLRCSGSILSGIRCAIIRGFRRCWTVTTLAFNCRDPDGVVVYTETINATVRDALTISSRKTTGSTAGTQADRPLAWATLDREEQR